ncbi:MAG: OadG family protein [Chloroflexi bacterium]|nr:OadG family protein [Chloroflexota bacterium]
MSNFLVSLQITALGMGIVFGAIILLAVMMSLLTRLTAERQEPSESRTDASDSAAPASVMEKEYKAQAAAVAVAMAIAEQRLTLSASEPPTALVSAWQLGMRTRQLYQKGISLRQGTRKAE